MLKLLLEENVIIETTQIVSITLSNSKVRETCITMSNDSRYFVDAQPKAFAEKLAKGIANLDTYVYVPTYGG